MRRVLVILVATVCALTLASAPASAETRSRSDADDTRGRLDVAMLKHADKNEYVVHRIRTHDKWRSRLLARKATKVRFSLRIDQDISGYDVFRRNGVWRCRVVGSDITDPCADRGLTIKRPDKRVMVIKIVAPPAGLTYRWRVRTFHRGHVDRAPDQGWIKNPA